MIVLSSIPTRAKHVPYIAHVTGLPAMLDVINFTEARNNLKSVLDKVVDDANVTIIARAGFNPFGQVLAQFMIVWQR